MVTHILVKCTPFETVIFLAHQESLIFCWIDFIFWRCSSRSKSNDIATQKPTRATLNFEVLNKLRLAIFYFVGDLEEPDV